MSRLTHALTRRRLIAVLFATGLAPMAEAGQGLPQPTGPTLLTVGGLIGHTNQNQTAVFDRAMLQSLGLVTIRTSTIWTTGVQTFTGVPLRHLLDAVAAAGSTVEASAANDYVVDIPVSDAVEGGPIIALLQNGQPMSLRDKGPLWLIYPYDSSTEYQSETIYARSVWQLDHLDILN